LSAEENFLPVAVPADSMKLDSEEGGVTINSTLITKKLLFENLLPYASLGKDTNEDGVVDGWTPIISPNVSTAFFFDKADGAQGINVGTATAQGFPGVRSDFIPVTAGAQYTLSCEMKGEGNLTPGPAGTGPRLQIKWFDATQTEIDNTYQSVQSVTPDAYIRTSVTGTAPANAAYAEARLIFRCHDNTATGTVWFRRAQFQKGGTATDYEETDFFTFVPVAPTYTSGWQIVEDASGNRIVQSEALPAGSTTWSGFQIKYFVPYNAEDNVKVYVQFDARRISAGETVQIFVNGNLRYTLNGGQADLFTLLIYNMPRGTTILTIRHVRPSDGTANGETASIEYFRVEWDELEAPPAQIELPEGRSVVKYIDFESEEYDPFFTVIDQAPGWSYGFERSFRKRWSGWWAYTVKDTADSGGTDEIGRPPTIPDNAVARALIKFKVPFVAVNPVLTLKALFFAATDEIGRIYLNNELLWEATGSDPFGVWQDITGYPIAGATNELIIEYQKGAQGYGNDDAIYIDDIIVAYDMPKKPIMYAATAPTVEIKTISTSFSVTEDFESPHINDFFTIQNPSKLKSGGGKSQYPEAGWIRSTKIAYQGSHCFRADRAKIGNSEDAAVDFIIKVPHGVKNAKVEWWNFVELERAKYAASGEPYPRMYEEYRVWVNYSLWKQFRYCSPDVLNRSAPWKQYWSCPWGKWWKETLPLSPGQTYTLTFELQRDSGDSSPIHGRDLCAIDNLTVTWEETPGEVFITPPEPLVYLDGREGIAYVDERNGAEMAPISFVEYPVFGVPGAIHQHTVIEPRTIDFPVVIHGENRLDVRRKIRELTQKLANRPLTLISIHPEDGARMIDCRFEGMEGAETETASHWQRRVLSFRCFDPFWHGDWISATGSSEIQIENPGDVEAWPIIKIYGPATNPLVELVKEDVLEQIRLWGFTINEGRYIVIDTRPTARTVMLDDGQSLYQYVDFSISKLFSIPRGAYTLRTNGAQIEATFRPPYWGV